jgi:phospholipid/cholesterol/gamma-HCH transport system permease protein
MGFLGSLGRHILKFIQALGFSSVFLFQALLTKPRLKSFHLLLKQFYVVGVLSLPIIIFAGFFVGMVLGLQGYTVLVKYGAESALGQMIALTLVRELGPVLGGLLFAGRACSALTAEIALLKTTEQLDSLRLLGVDPLHRVIAPRLWAGFFCLPMLVLIFNAVAIYGGYWISVDWLGIDSGSFWSSMQGSVDFREDIINGVIKSLVFALAVTWIAVYQGYVASPTSEGIGYATTRTVVYSSLVILALDFILTAVMFTGLK